MVRTVAVLLLLFIASAARAIPFFTVKRSGQISYLLGTNHGVPGEVLPGPILHQVRHARHVFVETLMTEDDHSREISEALLRDFDSSRDNKKLFTAPEWLKVKRLANSVEPSGAEMFRKLRPASALGMINFVFRKANAVAQNAGYQAYMEVLDSANDPEAKTLVAELKALAAEHAPYRDESEKEVMDDAVARIGLEHGALVTALDEEHERVEREKVISEKDLVRFVRSALRHYRSAEQWYMKYATDPRYVRRAITSLTPDFLAWTPEGNAAYDETFFTSGFQDPAERTKIHERHKDWLPRLQAALEEGGAFIAVGLGHVVDTETEGLISMLQKQGYEVTFAGNSCDLRLEK